jgi:myo-inositol-1(or 4)-monophosphatase
MNELTEYQKIILEAAEKAGDVLVGYFKQGHHVVAQFKANRHQLLTKADTESQDIIESTLRKSMKTMGHSDDEIGFIGEESLHKPSQYTFIIDPIDGTTNFAYGMNHFCISIALYKDEKPFVGCVYIPLTKIAYIAQEGKGAYKIDRSATSPLQTLHVDHTPLPDSIFLTEPSYRSEEMYHRIELLKIIQPQVQSIRMLGSAALDFCMITDGQAELALGGAHMWDFAAVDIIVRAAGGATADWAGNPFKIDLNLYMKRHHIIACHPQNLQEFSTLVKSVEFTEN